MASMGFLQGLSAFGQGAQQGMSAQQQFLMRAQQIQQMQAQLDQAKQDLKAKAAVFAQQGQQGQGGQGGPMGGMTAGQPQPPMPGQPSQPSQPQMGPQGAPQGGAPPSGPNGQGAPPMPMQGAQQPPMPQPQQAPMGAPQGGGGKPQGQDQGSLDPAQIVQRIAMGIKQRNPGIDPATLFDATSQMIDLMKGVQPDIKAQLQAQAQMFKQAYDTANLQQKGQIADENIQSREKIAGERDATSSANTQARLQGEMQRAQYIQTSIDAREKSGETTKATAAAQRTIMTGLTTQLRTLTTQYNGIMSGQPAGTDPSTVPAAQAIQKKIDSVTQKIDAAEKRFAGGPAPKAAAQATAQTGDKPGSLAAAQGGLPDGLPDPSKYPEGSQVKDKSTGKVVAIKKDGTWITP